jgi:hypothetical protein
VAQKVGSFCNLNNLTKENNRPISEKLPNLVTLLLTFERRLPGPNRPEVGSTRYSQAGMKFPTWVHTSFPAHKCQQEISFPGTKLATLARIFIPG